MRLPRVTGTPECKVISDLQSKTHNHHGTIVDPVIAKAFERASALNASTPPPAAATSSLAIPSQVRFVMRSVRGPVLLHFRM